MNYDDLTGAEFGSDARLARATARLWTRGSGPKEFEARLAEFEEFLDDGSSHSARWLAAFYTLKLLPNGGPAKDLDPAVRQRRSALARKCSAVLDREWPGLAGAPEVMAWLGLSFLNTDEKEAAVQAFLRAERLGFRFSDSKNDWLCYAYACACEETGRVREADRMFRHLTSRASSPYAVPIAQRRLKTKQKSNGAVPEELGDPHDKQQFIEVENELERLQKGRDGQRDADPGSGEAPDDGTDRHTD